MVNYPDELEIEKHGHVNGDIGMVCNACHRTYICKKCGMDLMARTGRHPIDKARNE
jgi:hypothetical protein